MLSVFPQILYLAPAGLALTRLAAGVAFLWLAYYHGTNARSLSSVRFPLVGSGRWVVYTMVVLELSTGLALTLGLYTQPFAILAALLALKSLVWSTKYPHFFPIDRVASALLLAISLSLIVSGAGAYAFDLPL